MLSNSVLFYVGGRVLNAALSFTTLLVINRLITPEHYGRFAYLTMIGGLLSLLCFGWVWFFSFRHGGVGTVAGNLQRGTFWVLLSSPMALVLLLLFGSLQSVSKQDLWFIFLYSVVLALFNIGQKIHAASSQLKENILNAVLRSFTNLSMLLILIFLMDGAYSLYIAAVFGYLAVALFVFARYRDIQWATWQELPKLPDLKYGIGIAASALIAQLNYGLDKFVINNALGDKSTGLYTHSYELIFFLIMFVFSIYNISNYPKLQKQYDNKELSLKDVLARSAKWFLLIAAGLILLLVLVKPLFVYVISENYSQTFSELYQFNIVIGILTCFVAFHVNYAFQLSKRPKFQLVAGSIAFGVNLVLSLQWVDSYGLKGVASATIVAQVLMIVIALTYSRRLN